MLSEDGASQAQPFSRLEREARGSEQMALTFTVRPSTEHIFLPSNKQVNIVFNMCVAHACVWLRVVFISTVVTERVYSRTVAYSYTELT